MPHDESCHRRLGEGLQSLQGYVDTNQPLASHYGISSIPAILIFKAGKLAARHVGVVSAATLRAEMQRLSA